MPMLSMSAATAAIIRVNTSSEPPASLTRSVKSLGKPVAAKTATMIPTTATYIRSSPNWRPPFARAMIMRVGFCRTSGFKKLRGISTVKAMFPAPAGEKPHNNAKITVAIGTNISIRL